MHPVVQEYKTIQNKSFANKIDGKDVLTLSLQEAITRGISENLDLRVAALEVLAADDNLDLERLSGAPDLSVNASYLGRSNEGASSSRSFLTGNESLEPSISTDQYRRTLDLDMRWNLLQTALSVSRAREAKASVQISSERYKIAIGDVMKDITTAYWRAWTAQESTAEIEKLLKQAENHLERIEKARARDTLFIEETARNKANLIQEMETLQNLREQMAFSENELKGLLSIPQHVKLTLENPDENYAALTKDILNEDLTALETEALLNRPEIKEASLNVEIAQNAIRREVLAAVPGFEVFAGYNKDTNSFLENNNWLNFSASIIQNLTSVITLPKRYQAAQNTKTLEEQKLLALSTAIAVQVHIARHRLNLLHENASLGRQQEKALADLSYTAQEKYKSGFVSGQEKLTSEIRALTGKLRARLAQTELQDAHLAMALTLGRPVEDRFMKREI